MLCERLRIGTVEIRSGNVRRCAVCQMEFEDGDEVATLPCTHFYHPDCIGQWLRDRKVRSAPL